jgi:uncharacterized membrane protein YkoI
MRIIRTAVLAGAITAVGSALAGAQQSTAQARTSAEVRVNEPAAIKIKAGLEGRARISPDSAKAIALSRVRGQVAGGELDDKSGRLAYEIKILPEHKKTYTKVVVDARTGRVISAKQYGGVRGAVGYVRESANKENNEAKAKKP